VRALRGALLAARNGQRHGRSPMPGCSTRSDQKPRGTPQGFELSSASTISAHLLLAQLLTPTLEAGRRLGLVVTASEVA